MYPGVDSNNPAMGGDARPPSYHPPQDNGAPQAPPAYEGIQTPAGIASNSTPYLPFPLVMSLHNVYELGRATFKTVKLCRDEDPNDLLYLVESHTGAITRRGPLGDRPGFYLHNGKAVDDPILAAVGDVSRAAGKALSFNCNSTILLPPLDGAAMTDLHSETMRAATNAEGVPIFRFTVETGTEKIRREDFEWRKVKKFASTGTGGFELFRQTSSAEGQNQASSSNHQVASSIEADGSVAVLTWAKTGLVRKHEFTLRLKNPEFGPHWTLTVVMTALRLWYMRWFGKTSKFSISMGEKVGANREH